MQLSTDHIIKFTMNTEYFKNGDKYICKRCGFVTTRNGRQSHWYQVHILGHAAWKRRAADKSTQQRYGAIVKSVKCKGCIYVLSYSGDLPCGWCVRKEGMKDYYSMTKAS